jgi:hypothetical protein
MNIEEIISNLKSPRNPYDRDLKSLREAVFYVLGLIDKLEEKPEVKAEKPKKAKTDE